MLFWKKRLGNELHDLFLVQKYAKSWIKKNNLTLFLLFSSIFLCFLNFFACIFTLFNRIREENDFF
jgi:hypothetical protein